MKQKSMHSLIVASTLAAMVVVTSCRKEDLTKAMDLSTELGTERGQIADRKIVFKTIADYRNLIDSKDPKLKKAFIKNANAASLFKTYGSAKNGNVLDDDLVRCFLDKDSCVQIGEWVIKLSTGTESVYVVNKSKKNSIGDLLKRNTNNQDVLKYSFNDDVLDLLESGTAPSRACNETSRSTYQQTWWHYFNNQVNKFVIDEVNYNGGVVFFMEYRAKPEIYSGGTWSAYHNTNFRYRLEEGYNDRKLRCAEWEQTYEAGTVESCGGDFIRRPYYRSRGLHKYHLKTRWSASTDNGATFEPPSINFIIQANYP